ncbi:MAG: hypothetical protein FWE42_05425 [Defluviitaleaceae bacterium]|nr:hypothetical protein [Defluviitaleaceae bacterium]
MVKFLEEGNLRFDFSSCPLVSAPEKFDENPPNGTSSVDFVAETTDCLYFIEVKDYQNPNSPEVKHQENYTMLVAAGKGKKELLGDELSSLRGEIFCLRISQNVKDSLLRKYVLGEVITKKVIYLIFINLDKLGQKERRRLKEKLHGYIPTGFNEGKYIHFKGISYDIVNAEQIKTYGITCTTKA